MKELVQKFREIQHREGYLLALRSAHSFVRGRIAQSNFSQGARKFNFYTKSRYIIQKKYYACPAQPYKPIFIDPKKITFCNFQFHSTWGLGQIKGGGWDTDEHTYSIDNDWIYKGLKQRFEEGKNWEDTAYVDRAKREFQTDESFMGYRNIEEFLNKRCYFVDSLYQNIRENGYRANFDAEHKVPDADKKGNEKKYKHQLEPLVAIGRKGNIYLRSGFHRLTIAKMLEIDSIPVNVLGRHRIWQNTRDQISRGVVELSGVSRNHPDLLDIE